jgi:hypothetical protein
VHGGEPFGHCARAFAFAARDANESKSDQPFSAVVGCTRDAYFVEQFVCSSASACVALLSG